MRVSRFLVVNNPSQLQQQFETTTTWQKANNCRIIIHSMTPFMSLSRAFLTTDATLVDFCLLDNLKASWAEAIIIKQSMSVLKNQQVLGRALTCFSCSAKLSWQLKCENIIIFALLSCNLQSVAFPFSRYFCPDSCSLSELSRICDFLYCCHARAAFFEAFLHFWRIINLAHK